MVNSCKGYRACTTATARSVVNSCITEQVCYFLGANHGEVGDITNSCNGMTSCKKLGKDGDVGNIENSCNGRNACSNLGNWGGEVGKIMNLCNGKESYQDGGRGVFEFAYYKGFIFGGIEMFGCWTSYLY